MIAIIVPHGSHPPNPIQGKLRAENFLHVSTIACHFSVMSYEQFLRVSQ